MKQPPKIPNLKVIFHTNDPDQLLNFLQPKQLLNFLKTSSTQVIHAYADQVDEAAFVTALFHTTNIEEAITELADYPKAFIKRAFYVDDTVSQEELETAKAWIATTIINQFENRHDNISYYSRYQSQPVSNISSYLESKDFKNGIFATQYEDKLLCDLYGQTGEKTYLFEGNRKD
jgi:hypothetical protein